MIADPICDILAADAILIAGLAQYDFGAGDAPAIFDFAPAPETCHQPLITVEEDGGFTTGTRENRGSNMRATVSLWGNKNHSRAALRDLAKAAWRALDRTNMTLENPYCEVGCWADYPREATDRQGFPGFIMFVRMVVHEDV